MVLSRPIEHGVLEIKSGKLFLSDMRLGPSEDGQVFEVEPGLYPILSMEDDTGRKVYRVSRNGVQIERSIQDEKISAELCLVGCFDIERVIQEFGSFKSLYEWGDDAVSEKQDGDVFRVLTPDGLPIVCLPAGHDEVDHDIYKLYSNDSLVGFEVYVQEYADESKQTYSIDNLYKFVFEFDKDRIEIYASTDYDNESILDELKDKILDFIQNDDVRINQIINNQEPSLDEEMELRGLDSRLALLKVLEVFSVDEEGEECLLRNITDFNGSSALTMRAMLKLVSKNMFQLKSVT